MLAVALVTLVLAVLLIPLGVIGFEFIPPSDRGELYLTITYPTGTPLEKTREAVLATER